MLLRHPGFGRLCRARDVLAAPSELSVPIHAIAREVGMSPSHFIHQFEALFGCTPHQFRIAERIERAKRLLATGECSVTEACMEVGFSSLGSFSSLFLRRVGESPSAYRRRARVLVAVNVQARVPLELFPGCLTLLAHLPSSCQSIFREAS
jgi:AraC-like DNA-binding protein